MSALKPVRLAGYVRHDAQGIASRAAAMEARIHTVLPHDAPWSVRLDGVGFRTYTARMQKPFDATLTRAMVLTARDVMARFPAARAAYVQSDEMTFVFPPASAPADVVYSGRLQKIVSVTASLAAASFNAHMDTIRVHGFGEKSLAYHSGARSDTEAPCSAPLEVSGALCAPDSNHEVGCAQTIQVEETSDKPLTKSARGERAESVTRPLAFFDARAFSTVSAHGAAENVLWRHALDGTRNAVSMSAAAHMSSKRMHGMSLAAMLRALAAEHDVHPFRDHSPAAMRGVVLKRALVHRPGFNPITGEASVATRMRIEGRSLDLTALRDIDALAELIFAPTWTDDHPPSLCPITLS